MKKKWVFAGLALALGLLTAFALHFVKIGYEWCHPSRRVVTSEERARALEHFPGLQEVSFTTEDHLTLRGWFVPPKNGVVVILVHGLYANRAALAPDAEVMVRHGYGVLLFDSRAHGDSGGTAATWGSKEASDNEQAVRFVKAQPGVTQVALLGFSCGGSSVSRTVADDPTVRAIILYATWTSLRDEIAYKVPRGGWLGVELTLLGYRLSGSAVDEIEPARDMSRIAPRPLLMLSGGVDSDTPAWAMDRLFALASSPKELWREPEVGHGGYFQADPAEYERRVIGFLDRVFSK